MRRVRVGAKEGDDSAVQGDVGEPPAAGETGLPEEVALVKRLQARFRALTL